MNDPEKTPVHVFDIATSPNGESSVDVRQLNVVAEPDAKRAGGSIFRAEFGPALKKLDELTAEKPEPPA